MHTSLLLPTLLLPALVHAQAPLLTLESPNPEFDGIFGVSVSGVPDVDGDGRGDLLVGASFEDVDGLLDAGRAYLFSGATGALLHTLTSPNPQESGRFGQSVSGVPDADGDGRGDLLIGVPGESGGVAFAGRVYLFSGATGARLRTFRNPSLDANARFGSSVSGVSDTDGDGQGDFFAGAIGEDGGLRNAGRVHLFSGATGAFLHTLESSNPDELGGFGEVVSGVADADGDGRGDLLVGSVLEDANGVYNASWAYLFSGATGTLIHALVSPNAEGGGEFGSSASGVADADGDGRGDLLIGAHYEDGGAEDAGRAYLFSGATGALRHTLTSPNPEVDGFFGYSVSGVLDADGDGHGDLLIGAYREGGGGSDPGRAHLYNGVTGALVQTLKSPYPASSGWFGWCVAGVEDTDGDGRSDLLVSATHESGGAPNAGRVYLFSGATLVASEPGPETPALGLTVAPNPARDRAAFALSLPQAGPVRLSVHDVLGREVAVLINGEAGAGARTVAFDARGLASGVYIWRLAADGSVQTGRLTLLQ